MTRLIPAAGLLAAVVLSAGCGTPGDPAARLSPVRGTLHAADGKPAAGATVTLHPIDGRSLDPLPFALVGADGAFVIGSRTTGEGAPPGTYAVTVVWRSVVPSESPEDRLKGRFADPKRPLATVTVSDGEAVLDPLKLK
ncbi:MAG: carboxypeptidase-like regulatory domain-containing protein [Gemmataceae bacterium]|nr:carboxypeptidase-like regulatory domain-containing protein [Gemmataceae bacterium]